MLDTGCGLGGTSRYMAREHGWVVTGITISDTQVTMAYDLSRRAATSSLPDKESLGDTSHGSNQSSTVQLNNGTVRYIQLDAETLHPHFAPSSFDIVWISEALSHLPDKPLFFKNAYTVLTSAATRKDGTKTGRLVIADWVKAPQLSEEKYKMDIVPIEVGMLLPPLATSEEYCEMAKKEGFELVGDVMDISDKVAKTWCVHTGLTWQRREC